MGKINGRSGQGEQIVLITTSRPTGKVTAKKLRQLIDLQNYCCALTGDELTPETASVDHKIPISKGGTNVMENVQVLHSEVNRMKGSMSTLEFILLCRKIIKHIDDTL